jgi:hypothetical protein
MNLSSLIGGPNWGEAWKRARQETQIEQILAEWRSPPWKLDELMVRYSDFTKASIIRSIRYWPDGRIREIEYQEPSYTAMLRDYKPWVLVGTYRGEGLFAWEHRYL